MTRNVDRGSRNVQVSRANRRSDLTQGRRGTLPDDLGVQGTAGFAGAKVCVCVCIYIYICVCICVDTCVYALKPKPQTYPNCIPFL